MQQRPGNGRGEKTAVEFEKEKKEQRVYRCKECATEITSPAAEAARSGKHSHTFFNPQGVVYNIGCFARAENLIIQSEPSNEFSWFAGYAWQVVACSQCGAHLGWLFGNENDSFFGLILTALVY